MQYLPLYLNGEVVKGFGRGSKELGIPTANYPLEVVQRLPSGFEPGVYYGWAQVNNGSVHKMVANIGWCPFYNNTEKSIETHIMHKFDRDFYGDQLKIIVVGFLRGEENFSSLDQLIDAINNDIKNSQNFLDKDDNIKYKNDKFFTEDS